MRPEITTQPASLWHKKDPPYFTNQKACDSAITATSPLWHKSPLFYHGTKYAPLVAYFHKYIAIVKFSSNSSIGGNEMIHNV